MATIKIKFRPSYAADQMGTIYYQITHERKVRQITTPYHLFQAEWDNKRDRISDNITEHRKLKIRLIRKHISQDIACMKKIIHKFDLDGLTYTSENIIEEYVRFDKEYSLYNFMKSLIVKFKNNGKLRTSETYTSALNSFRKFRGGEDIRIDWIDSEIMEAFQAWHKEKGNCPNTISFYNRILRAVYNRALETDLFENRSPFRHVYTGVDKTVKRAVPLSIIKKINTLDLSTDPKLDYARDIFMMSFFLRGMSFIDMAYLKKTDFRNSSVVYRRRKTDQQLSIGWTQQMQSLIAKYTDNSSRYLLPIIRRTDINEHYTYRNVGYKINRNLKKIAELLGISTPLTMYVARHSWASAAQFKGIPLNIISEGLGHDSEATTRIYLSSLDTSAVDQANDLILSDL